MYQKRDKFAFQIISSVENEGIVQAVDTKTQFIQYFPILDKEARSSKVGYQLQQGADSIINISELEGAAVTYIKRQELIFGANDL